MTYFNKGYSGLVELHNVLNSVLHDDSLCAPGTDTHEGMRRADLNMVYAELPADVRAAREAESNAEIEAYGHRVGMMLFYARMLHAALTDVIDRDDWFIKHMEHYIRRQSGLDRESRAKLLRATRSMNNKVRMCYGAPEAPEEALPGDDDPEDTAAGFAAEDGEPAVE